MPRKPTPPEIANIELTSKEKSNPVCILTQSETLKKKLKNAFEEVPERVMLLSEAKKTYDRLKDFLTDDASFITVCQVDSQNVYVSPDEIENVFEAMDAAGAELAKEQEKLDAEYESMMAEFNEKKKKLKQNLLKKVANKKR